MKATKALSAAARLGLWSALALAVSSLTQPRDQRPSLGGFWGSSGSMTDPQQDDDMFNAYYDLFYGPVNSPAGRITSSDSSATSGGESNHTGITRAPDRIITLLNLQGFANISANHRTSKWQENEVPTSFTNSTVLERNQTLLEHHSNISANLETPKQRGNTESKFPPKDTTGNLNQTFSVPTLSPSEDSSHLGRKRSLFQNKSRQRRRAPPIERPQIAYQRGFMPTASFGAPRYATHQPRMAFRRRQSYSDEQAAYQDYHRPHKIKVVKVKTPPPKGLSQVNTQMADFFSKNFWIPMLGAFFLAGTAVRIGLTERTTPTITNITTSILNDAIIIDSGNVITEISEDNGSTLINTPGTTSIFNSEFNSFFSSAVGITSIITNIINTSRIVSRTPPTTIVNP